MSGKEAQNVHGFEWEYLEKTYLYGETFRFHRSVNLGLSCCELTVLTTQAPVQSVLPCVSWNRLQPSYKSGQER